jgi:hypothetical protein
MALGFAFLSVLFVACGDDGPPPTDSGMGDTSTMSDSDTPDSDGVDTSVPPTEGACTGPIEVAGEIGAVTVSGDTDMATLRPVDLGVDCGNPEAARFSPQEIVAYTVPGTEEVGVRFTLANAGTDMDFVAIAQVRTDCMTQPAADMCFQDVTDTERHASGAVTAMGGDTIYIVVTGIADIMSPYTDRGAWEMEITAGPNEPPTLVGGQLSRVGDALEVALSGMDDTGGDSYRMELQMADGTGIDLNDDGMVDEGDWIVAPFTNDVSEMMSFVGRDRFAAIGADILDADMVTQAEVTVRDVFRAESAPMTITIGDGIGVGGSCDDTTFCADALTCTSMMCEASTEATTACASPTALTIATPTTTTETTTVTGSIPAGTGALAPTCTSAVGPEVTYGVTVPGGGTFDVVARTDLTGTGETDTMLYLRGDCTDPITETACNDDIDLEGGVYTSHMELLDAPAGDYVLIVEQWATEPTDTAGAFELEVGLRPVLASGASCDNAGVMNRCADGACSGGTCP